MRKGGGCFKKFSNTIMNKKTHKEISEENYKIRMAKEKDILNAEISSLNENIKTFNLYARLDLILRSKNV